jgi:beta-barrel assembly-enhancing protease
MVKLDFRGVVLLSIFLSSFSFAQQDIGALAVQLQKLDSPKAEKEVGYKTASRILGSTPLVNDQELTKYINLVGKALAANSPGQTYNWTFGVIQTEDINAFAAPSGYIFVTKGLLKQLTSEDQLAAVLAHEIAHVRFKHYTNVAKKQMLAEYSMKSLNAGNEDSQLEAMATATTLVLARGLDKQSEFDADREAAKLLAKTGYDPAAMADVLVMLEKKAAQNNSSMSFLLTTHPNPTQRLQALAACCADAFANVPSVNPKTKSRFDSQLKSRL